MVEWRITWEFLMGSTCVFSAHIFEIIQLPNFYNTYGKLSVVSVEIKRA
jgi:hypothetical protein